MIVGAHDLPSIFSCRRALLRADPRAASTIEVLDDVDGCSSIALLPGSFNPPTAAHLLLAERARRAGFDCVAFVLARATAGKDPGGLIPEDRLAAMRMSCSDGLTVAVCSRGLYADQAEAVAEAFPGAEVTFLVGSDKVAQIFDPSWYDDRDASLERLFTVARILVSPRADDGGKVRDLLAAPENRAFAGRIEILPLHPAVSDLSSTRVRGLLQSGADPSRLVPPAVAGFLAETRAFAPPLLVAGEEIDAYHLRARLIEALWHAREWSEQGADLAELLRLALERGEDGARLRRLLGQPEPDEAELVRLAAVATA